MAGDEMISQVPRTCHTTYISHAIISYDERARSETVTRSHHISIYHVSCDDTTTADRVVASAEVEAVTMRAMKVRVARDAASANYISDDAG